MNSAIIEGSVRRFSDDPAPARSAPAVTAQLTDGHAELSAGAFTWAADLSPALGGGNTAPSPTAYLLGALAGCAAAFLRDTLGPQFGVQIDGVTAVARCRSDARGLLGMEGALPDLADLELEVTVSSPEPEERLEPVYQAWLERCPIYLAITRPNLVVTRFQTRADVEAQRAEREVVLP
jgi:uncharacterized OsmC-like protein